MSHSRLNDYLVDNFKAGSGQNDAQKTSFADYAKATSAQNHAQQSSSEFVNPIYRICKYNCLLKSAYNRIFMTIIEITDWIIINYHNGKTSL